MKKKIIITICCIAALGITACGKKSDTEAIQTDNQTIEVTNTANSKSNETFELINDTLILEAGEKLDTNVETYVKTDSPENIYTLDIEKFNTMVDRQKDQYIILGDYNIEFINETNREKKTMIVTLVDTIPPKVTISSNESTIYLREPDLMGEPVIINTYFDPDFTVEVSDYTHCHSYYKSIGDETESPSSLSNFVFTSYSFDTLPKPGDFEDVFIVCDAAGNKTEIPVTFHFIDDLPPDDQP